MTKQVTKKPIPTESGKWQREVDGIRTYLKKLRQSDLGEGEAWRKGHLVYYQTRLDDLLAHQPKASRKRKGK